MGDHRGAVLTSGGALVAAAAAIIALVKGNVWLSVILFALGFTGLVVVAVVFFSDLLGLFRGWRSSTDSGPDELEHGVTTLPANPFSARWRYTTEGGEAVSVSWGLQKAVSHPGYLQDPYDPRPSHLVLVVLVPCAPLAEMPPTSDIVRSFLKLLTGATIRTLIDMLAPVDDDVAWYSYASNGPLNNQAILARSADDREPPVATAILNLNDTSMRVQHFQDPKRAELIIRIEHRSARRLTLPQLQAWSVAALTVPDGFAAFLADELHVPTYDDPAVHVGVLLEGRNDLTDLIDPGDVESPPGMGRSKSFPLYLLADRAGKQPRAAALDAIRGCCDYGLHVHGYEGQLDQLRGEGQV